MARPRYTTTKTRHIGRNLTSASLRRRSGPDGLWILEIKGDRGDIRMNLTEDEANYLTMPDGSDRLGLTLVLPDGEKDVLRRSFEQQLRTPKGKDK